MVQDLVHNLCESLVVNIGGVAGIGKKTPPTPITYLTQWKIVGNSEVHGDEYLKSWKVSGNSVVDNNTILSCGDLGQDGKYHVKISNGVTIYDIPLDAPLRKVNDVADTIEFANGVATLTRNFASADLGSFTWLSRSTSEAGKNRYSTLLNLEVLPNCIGLMALCSKYNVIAHRATYYNEEGIEVFGSSNVADGQIGIYDPNADTLTTLAFKNYVQGVELIYQVTPTTELIDVSSFSASPTYTYTSANVVPFSAFEHTENKEIWSCGEYNPTDGKYHILVQPLGGSIADIALSGPLRKVNDVADTIEFPSGTESKALVTRKINSIRIGPSKVVSDITIDDSKKRMVIKSTKAKPAASENDVANIICSEFNTIPFNTLYSCNTGIAVDTTGRISFYTPDYNTTTDTNNFKKAYKDLIIIFERSTPSTELVDAPQIEEAESYSMVISQGGKAVSWSSFETE